MPDTATPDNPTPAPAPPVTPVMVGVGGQYALVEKDTSLDSWSRPEWMKFMRVTLAAAAILVGSLMLLLRPNIPDQARTLALMLGPAAGFKLLEVTESAKRGGK